MAGLGAYLSGQPVSGLLSQEERYIHINVLEMKAVLLAVRDQEICLATDNSTVVAYINNRGGGHKVSDSVYSVS